jgi:hypothetical protein
LTDNEPYRSLFNPKGPMGFVARRGKRNAA